EAIMRFLIRQNILSMHCPLLRAEMIRETGFFDETLPGCEDWEYWIRCALHGKSFHFQTLGDDLALVRVHPTNTSKNARMMLDTTLQMRRKLDLSRCDLESARFNEQHIHDLKHWIHQLDEATLALREHIPAGAEFILI